MPQLCLPLAVLALAVGTVVSGQTPAGSPARNAADIEQLMRQALRIRGKPDSAFGVMERMRYWHVPGMSLAVIDDFKIAFARGFGVTEFGGNTPVDTTTLFLAGSISKPVFATGMLRLVQEGKLLLDEDVNAKLKSWRLPDSRFTEREKVTLRRILTHTAGLTVWGFPGYAATAALPTIPQVLDGADPANTDAVRNDTTPGARWRYSGGGFTIAHLLASDATGESFPALMQRVVLKPAGMTRSTYENPLPATRHREAASGHERIDTPVPGRFHTYPEMAAAGLWTTAPELARWALALTHAYNGATDGVLSPERARQMISNQVAVGPDFGGGFFGLGVRIAGEGDSVSFSHNGRDAGFVAQLSMWPRLGRGYVVLTNGVSGAMLNEIRRAFAEIYGIGATPRPEIRAVDVDSSTLLALVGDYLLVQGSDTIVSDVSVERGVLMLYSRFGKRLMRLWAESPNVFVDTNSGQTYIFERDSTAGSRARAIRFGRNADAPRALRRN